MARKVRGDQVPCDGCFPTQYATGEYLFVFTQIIFCIGHATSVSLIIVQKSSFGVWTLRVSLLLWIHLKCARRRRKHIFKVCFDTVNTWLLWDSFMGRCFLLTCYIISYFVVGEFIFLFFSCFGWNPDSWLSVWKEHCLPVFSLQCWDDLTSDPRCNLPHPECELGNDPPSYPGIGKPRCWMMYAATVTSPTDPNDQIKVGILFHI